MSAPISTRPPTICCRRSTTSAAPVVFVSNEVGLGLVPETPLGRSFRDAQGRLNMRIAERADRVILMAAGLPLTMKDRPPALRPSGGKAACPKFAAKRV